MDYNLYDQFTQITQIDNSAVKSVFMHLNSIVSKVNNVKFTKAIIALKNEESYTLVYELDKGNIIPASIFSSIQVLFANPEYLTHELIITIEVLYDNKLYNITYNEGDVQYPDVLSFLFTNNTFNFFTGVYDYKNPLEIFEHLFNFLIKKDLNTSIENIFKIQFDKYYSGLLQETDLNLNAKSLDNEILIEKLLTSKNEIFSRINIITRKSVELKEEKDKLLNYSQNKEKYSVKYESLKNDYKMLLEQEQTFFKTVKELDQIIDHINNELNSIQIHINMNNLPETEKTKLNEEKDFLIARKLKFTDAKTEAEANLLGMRNLMQSTKINMESIHNELNSVNSVDLLNVDNYDEELSRIKHELDDLYLNASSIDIEISKLQKENAGFNISREYAELKNKGTNDIELNALKTTLSANIIPAAINIAYKYLCNLFLYNYNDDINVTLEKLNIKPQTFFVRDKNSGEIIIL